MTTDTDHEWRQWAEGSAVKLLRRGEGFGIAHQPGRGRSSILWTFDSHTYARHTGAESPYREPSTFRQEVGHRAARHYKETTR